MIQLGSLKLPVNSFAFEYWHIVNYGRSGSGKSQFLSSSADCVFTNPSLILDFERGQQSSLLRSPGSISVVYMPEFMHINNYSDVSSATRAIITKLLDSSDLPFKFIGIDSISEFARQYLNKLKGSKPKATWDEHGQVLDFLSTLFRDLNSLPIHLGINAKERRFGQFDDDGNAVSRTILRPFLTENASVDMVGVFDLVLHFEGDIEYSQGKKSYKNWVTTQITEAAEGKDRSGQLPIVLEMPTMDKVFSYLRKVSVNGHEQEQKLETTRK